MPNQGDDRRLILSVDAKPRLKWTRHLHERFVDAVSQLGGADKATPKSVMRVMGIPGLTLYHLKSHLQKYRLAKSRDPNIPPDNRKRDCEAAEHIIPESKVADTNDDNARPEFDEGVLRIQMEVQRKLQEQIEVQRHLHLRIEAQGKYLQSVLRKAQETLAGYGSNSLRAEDAKAELSELVSAVETQCLSSSYSGGSVIPKRTPHGDCSTDSCLTSSEDGKPQKLESSSSSHHWSQEPGEINPGCCETNDSLAASRTRGSKRSCSGADEETNVEQPATASGKRLLHQMDGDGVWISQELDLNT